MARNAHPASSVINQFGKSVLPWIGDDPHRADIIRRALQDAVSGQYPLTPVPVTVSARLQKQVDTVRGYLSLYGGGQPGFRPEDAALAVPLAGVPDDEQVLAVYLPSANGVHGFFRTMDTWFDFNGRDERPTWRNPDLKSESTCVRFRGEYRPGVRWVRFRKNHDAGRSSTDSRQRVVNYNGWLGGLEPLMAVSLLEGYFEGWFRDGNVAPNLSGIEVSLDAGKSWDFVACLSRWDFADGRRRLNLSVCSAGNADPDWGSPRVSEC